MLSAIQRKRYEVCGELLTLVARQDAGLTTNGNSYERDGMATARDDEVDAQRRISRSLSRDASIESRDWAVQIAYIVFRAHLDDSGASEISQSTTAADTNLNIPGVMRAAWFMPLVCHRQRSDPTQNSFPGLLKRDAAARKNKSSSVITHFDGPLRGLCQDAKSGESFLHCTRLMKLYLSRCLYMYLYKNKLFFIRWNNYARWQCVASSHIVSLPVPAAVDNAPGLFLCWTGEPSRYIALAIASIHSTYMHALLIYTVDHIYTIIFQRSHDIPHTAVTGQCPPACIAAPHRHR